MLRPDRGPHPNRNRTVEAAASAAPRVANRELSQDDSVGVVGAAAKSSSFTSLGSTIFTPLAGTVGVASSRSAFGSDRKSTRLNSSHSSISYAVFCLKKKKKKKKKHHTKTTTNKKHN